MVVMMLVLPEANAGSDTEHEGMINSGNVQICSIVAIIANPRIYDNKTVLFIGYLDAYDGVIWMSEEYQKNAVLLNCICIIDNWDKYRNMYVKYDKKFVVLEGLFSTEVGSTHNCTGVGSITKLKRISEWPPSKVMIGQ